MESANPKGYNRLKVWKRKEGEYFLCKGYNVLFHIPAFIGKLLT